MERRPMGSSDRAVGRHRFARVALAAGFAVAGLVAIAASVALARPIDSVRPAMAHDFVEFIEQWHEFYLMTGTAAVTLAGLLFVALSIHIDQLVHDSRSHLLSLSRHTLSSFVFVLAVSLAFLAPGLRPRILGFELIAFGVVFGGMAFRQLRRPASGQDPRLTYDDMKNRFRVPLIGYAMIVAVGVATLVGIYEMLYWMVAAMCLLLGNAAGTSWELLVKVAAAKKDAGEPKA
jgi:hypothetical protein